MCLSFRNPDHWGGGVSSSHRIDLNSIIWVLLHHVAQMEDGTPGPASYVASLQWEAPQ